MTDFRDLIDLAGERLGGTVLYATDDFFAEKENLLKSSRPVWKEHDYTDRGKWMDGWESRRKRTPGHDYCIIRLGTSGVVKGIVVDTSYFRGNYPAECSLEGTYAPPETDAQSLVDDAYPWIEVLPRTALQGDSENVFEIETPLAFTHLRFHIYPDGGVARLRVHGVAFPEWRRSGGLGNQLDLAAVEHGGDVLTCSDMFFGPKHNLIMPGRAANMSDGWETRRRRGAGHDWVIVKLGIEGVIDRVEIDTSHFKGNYPDTCSLEGARVVSGTSLESTGWADILLPSKLQGHTRHFFRDEILSRGPFTHVRLNVYPDGGVSRLRIYGTATVDARREEVVRRLNRLELSRALEELQRCCGSSGWVEAMASSRPFDDWNSMLATADQIWMNLTKNDWLEAFKAHPRIGERGSSRWSTEEQSGVGHDAAVLQGLAEGNRRYEERFGHVFLICATGRSANEMLSSLRERLHNEPNREIEIAAEEQRKITHLRLEKLVL